MDSLWENNTHDWCARNRVAITSDNFSNSHTCRHRKEKKKHLAYQNIWITCNLGILKWNVKHNFPGSLNIIRSVKITRSNYVRAPPPLLLVLQPMYSCYDLLPQCAPYLSLAMPGINSWHIGWEPTALTTGLLSGSLNYVSPFNHKKPKSDNRSPIND